MIPGTAAHYWPTDLDDDERATWLIETVDKDHRHVAPILMPYADTDEALDAIEDEFGRAFEIARAGGRRFGVKLLVGQHVNSAEERILAIVHEHVFVGGVCVNGCTDREPVDDGDAEG